MNIRLKVKVPMATISRKLIKALRFSMPRFRSMNLKRLVFITKAPEKSIRTRGRRNSIPMNQEKRTSRFLSRLLSVFHTKLNTLST